ncbi:hypothetical protein [Micromonospora sp. S4605]|uniref:hypothetical protein n=1 Tax=Micromonospora sp. S4605 TaxID=1420897 RepID=UPI0011B47550|nr:hypothetical protein [Micromonospora sp. S4605]
MDERERIIEEALGATIADLLGDGERNKALWREALNPDRLTWLDGRLAAYYAGKESPTTPPNELHPALFESEMYYNFGGLTMFGPRRPPRTAVISEDLRQALLYGHGVALYDPIIGISSGGAPNQRSVVLRGALEFWHQFGALVEADVVRLEPPNYREFPSVNDAEEKCLDLICQSPDGRRALLELFDELQESFSGRPVDWVGRPNQPERANRKRAQRFREHLHYVELSTHDMFHAVSLDLPRFLFSRLMPATDVWLPSAQHLGYYLLLAQHGLGQVDADLEFMLLQSLATVHLPALNDLPVRDVVNLRRDSEVLEAWRQSLRDALAELTVMTEGGMADTATQRQLRNHLAGVASQTTSALRKARSAPFSDAARSMTFGVMGGATGAAFDGLRGLLVGTAAAAVSNAAQATSTIFSERAQRSALKARTQHALLFEEAQPGETTEQRRNRVLARRLRRTSL